MRSLLRRFGRLRGDQRGVTAIEFALLAPVVFLVIAGSIELGRLMMVKGTLEIAVASAAREARVDLGTGDADRYQKLRTRITSSMSSFNTYPGKAIEIEALASDSFGAAYPEGYEDVNKNGRYDGPDGASGGEPFDDRNRNGVRDLARQNAGSLGGTGDVVTYRVNYPVALLFDFLAADWIARDGVVFSSTVVLRNEPVKH